jgi:hypothetical protein
LFILLAGLLAWPLPCLRGQEDADVRSRSQVLALESIWNQAVTQQDMKALAAIFDDAFVYVDAEGLLMTKADFLARMKKAHVQRMVTESITAQMFGTTSIVTGTYRSFEMLDGKAVQRRGRFINAWVYKKGAWFCVAAQDTPLLR